MVIGCPKEIKTLENRVALTPEGVKELVADGHKVYVQKEAGFGVGFFDEDYVSSGAKILNSAEEIYELSQLIIKVKEPLEPEYKLIKKGQIIFAYFHFASSVELIEAMKLSEAVCIAYETVRDNNGALPLLVPMSMVAGRISIQEGMRFLTKPFGGLGILPGGIPGVKPAKVTVIGGGMVGTEAAKVASGMGADVTILDINQERLTELRDILPSNVSPMFSSKENLNELLKDTDLLVGAVLVPGAKAPKLVSEEQVKAMKGKSVIVDVAIDQGGCIATSRPTTFTEPTYSLHGVTHYGVANMPGAVAKTSTEALTAVTFPYLKKIVNDGWEKLAEQDKGFAEGVSIVNGVVVNDEILS